MTELNIDEIGFFKYKNQIDLIVECIGEYPITPEIIDYIKKTRNFEIVNFRNEPLKKEGKFIVSI